jgi:uncharacterized protein YaeQ
MKFTFTIKREFPASDPDKFVVKMGGSEVAWHIALKVLGYILFFDRKPQIEQDVGQHYRPDLFCWDEFQEKVALWIDCGNIAVKKIDKVATSVGKSGEFYILRRTKKDAERLREQIRNIKHPERVKIIAFEEGFVDKIAELIQSTNHIDFGIEDGSIGLSIIERKHSLQSKIINV